MSRTGAITLVKPTGMTWVLLLISPVPFFLGIAVWLAGERGWGAIFVGIAVANFLMKGRILWRWHSLRRADEPQRGSPAIGHVPAQEQPFMSPHVSWVPATLQSGLVLQPGWLVARPGWVAFLPSAAPNHLLAEMAWALGGVVQVRLGTLTYDFAGLYGQGPYVFDQTVFSLAQRAGRALNRSMVTSSCLPQKPSFEWIRRPLSSAIRSSPSALVSMWPIGKLRFDARQNAKVFGAISAVSAVAAGVCAMVAIYGHDRTAKWGVVFWVAVPVVCWIAYGLAVLKHR